MQKIITNRCYGGFGLSRATMLRYAELKELTLYLEHEDRQNTYTIYWIVSPEEREKRREEPWKERRKWQLHDYEIDRDDPALVQTIEELGSAANGDYAKLEITEIPDGIDWQVEEYDGKEWVAEAHRRW